MSFLNPTLLLLCQPSEYLPQIPPGPGELLICDTTQAIPGFVTMMKCAIWSMPELLARIRASLRRVPLALDNASQQITLEGYIDIDFRSRHLTVRGLDMRLTPKEFELLRYLVARPNETIPHRELLQAVWGADYGEELEYLRVFVNQLRKKIEPNPAKPKYLLTEPWVGYRFRLPGQS